MRIKYSALTETSFRQRGVSLIELMVFVVVVAIGLGALLSVFNQSVMQSVDPVIQTKALEKGQALMEEILTRKFDENTPTGGVPACDSVDGVACLGISPDGDYDDIGDYHGFTDTDDAGFTVTAAVTAAGADLGIPATQARLIQLTVTAPAGKSVVISAYKANF
jgi:MSHA pilin protein MshD